MPPRPPQPSRQRPQESGTVPSGGPPPAQRCRPIRARPSATSAATRWRWNAATTVAARPPSPTRAAALAARTSGLYSGCLAARRRGQQGSRGAGGQGCLAARRGEVRLEAPLRALRPHLATRETLWAWRTTQGSRPGAGAAAATAPDAPRRASRWLQWQRQWGHRPLPPLRPRCCLEPLGAQAVA